MIGIRLPEVCAGDELFARDLAHRRQHTRIAYATRAQLHFDHVRALLPQCSRTIAGIEDVSKQDNPGVELLLL